MPISNAHLKKIFPLLFKLYNFSQAKWSERAKQAHSVSEKIEKARHNFFAHTCPYMVQGGFVCVSVFGKIMNNFGTDKPIWMKFSGHSRLVMLNLVVGSTSAQSPPLMTGPAYSPFPCSLSRPWLWVEQGHALPFWKAFDETNHNVRADF